MTDFYNFLSSAPVKHHVTEQLKLAASSTDPLATLAEIFPSTSTPINSIGPLISAVSQAEKSKEDFNIWFNQLLAVACHDLLDEHGKLKSDIKELLQPSWKELKNNFKDDKQQLHQHLVYAYCQQLVKPYLGKTSEQFDKLWSQRLDHLTSGKLGLIDFIGNQVELQSKRILQHCEWLHYCIQHRESDPQRVWHAVANFYYAMDSLAYLKGGVFGLEVPGTFISNAEKNKLIKQVFPLGKHADQVQQVIAELKTMYDMVSLGDESCNIPADWQQTYAKLRSKHKGKVRVDRLEDGYTADDQINAHLKHHFLTLFSLLLQFINVGFNQIPGGEIIDQIDKAETSDNVLQFVKCFHDEVLELKFSPCEAKLSKKIESEFKAYEQKLTDTSTPLFERMQLRLSMREKVMYWLRTGMLSESKGIDETLAKCMSLLPELDQSLEQAFKVFSSDSPSDDSDYTDPGSSSDEELLPMPAHRDCSPVSSTACSVQPAVKVEKFEVETEATCFTFFTLLVVYVLEFFNGLGNLFQWLFNGSDSKEKESPSFINTPGGLFYLPDSPRELEQKEFGAFSSAVRPN